MWKSAEQKKNSQRNECALCKHGLQRNAIASCYLSQKCAILFFLLTCPVRFIFVVCCFHFIVVLLFVFLQLLCIIIFELHFICMCSLRFMVPCANVRKWSVGFRYLFIIHVFCGFVLPPSPHTNTHTHTYQMDSSQRNSWFRHAFSWYVWFERRPISSFLLFLFWSHLVSIIVFVAWQLVD